MVKSSRHSEPLLAAEHLRTSSTNIVGISTVSSAQNKLWGNDGSTAEKSVPWGVKTYLPRKLLNCCCAAIHNAIIEAWALSTTRCSRATLKPVSNANLTLKKDVFTCKRGLPMEFQFQTRSKEYTVLSWHSVFLVGYLDHTNFSKHLSQSLTICDF